METKLFNYNDIKQNYLFKFLKRVFKEFPSKEEYYTLNRIIYFYFHQPNIILDIPHAFFRIQNINEKITQYIECIIKNKNIMISRDILINIYENFIFNFFKQYKLNKEYLTLCINYNKNNINYYNIIEDFITTVELIYEKNMKLIIYKEWLKYIINYQFYSISNKHNIQHGK